MFALVCGQNPEHLWAPGGLTLPCCQRCTGLYAGAAGALLLHSFCPPPPTAGWKWLHGMFLLQMVPFGFHWLPQGPVLRTVTGVLFAFGVVAYLWLIPAARRSSATAPSPAIPKPGEFNTSEASALHTKTTARCYLLGVAATLVFVPVAAGWGGRFGFFALSGLAALGAVVLAMLAVANIGLGLAALHRRLFRSKPTAPA